MKGLCIENLTVGYGRRHVLKQLNLTVAPGETIAVLGANGCGKTTLLRAITGAIKPISGEIRVDGVDLSTLNARHRAAVVATMPQVCEAEPGLSGMDRIEMSFFPEKGLFGRLTAEERDRVRTMASEFDILSLLDRDLAAMSAGERQLIFLLSAAVRPTPVLLLDEPTSALDFQRTEEFFALTARLAQQGRAILTVLHDPTAAVRHTSSILLIDEASAERIDLTAPDYDAVERSLRRLYPHLKIYRDPLFCLSEREIERKKGKETPHAEH